MSMPTSAIAATAAGLISVPGSEPPDQATRLIAGEVGEVAQRHLGSAGVVGA